MDKNKKGLKLNETTKALLLLSAFLIIANVFLGMFLVKQSNAAMKALIDSRLLDISTTAADMIDGNGYETITSRDPSNPYYTQVYDTLKYFQDNIDLQFIYCIRARGDGTFYFTVDPALVDCSEYGEDVAITDALLTAQSGTSAVDAVPYEDAYGRFYSAYTPLFNSKNEVVGVIAVDFSAAYYDEQMHKNLMVIVIGIIFSITIGGIIIGIYSVNISRKEELGKIHAQANKMITAMASDYRSVYYVNLDKNEGVCYRSHSHMVDSLKENERFDYLKSFTDYANKYVTEEYREGFLDFISIDSIRERLAHEEIIAYKYLTDRNGRMSYEMLRMAGVRRPEDRDDNIIHAVGVGFTDVDEETREDLEQKKALKVALESAEEANKAKTVFLSNMSHEIRTPMNAIIGLDSLALSEPGLPDQVKEYLVKIGSSAHHLLGIINDILDMSRIESGNMSIRNEEFSLKNLVELISTMISSQCNGKNITFNYGIEGEIDDFYIGDDTKLKEIIINILSNAVKYTDPGGQVDFTIRKTAGFDNKATILFTMKDNGIGMDKEFLPKIFDSFSQEDVSAVNKYGSTGLGMAITKNLVDMLNGKIQVESEKGKGTTFYVTLTFEIAKKKETAAADASKSAESEASTLDFTKVHVLVAEDMDINAQILIRLLGQKGIKADRAENGQVALDMFTASEVGTYDAIFMDMRMPVMNGLESATAIRALDRADAKAVPIIALTANAFDEDVERSLQSGLNAHLSKPLEPDMIFKTLKRLVH